jgi:hypothetical protein
MEDPNAWEKEFDAACAELRDSLLGVDGHDCHFQLDVWEIRYRGTRIGPFVRNHALGVRQALTKAPGGPVAPKPEDDGRTRHMKAGSPVVVTGMIGALLVALVCVCGGLLTLITNPAAPTEMNIWGAKITTGHVGVAFIFIGVVVMAVVIRSGYSTLVSLGKEPDKPKKK